MKDGAIPFGLRLIWFFFAPLAILFAGRVMWEETVWTWERGPQMVGFSLLHIHPLFAITGALCCYLTMLWLALRRRYTPFFAVETLHCLMERCLLSRHSFQWP